MTPRQHSVMQAIRELTVDGVCPSMEQIADRVGLVSKGNVHKIIQDLIALGHLKRPQASLRARARSYEFVGRQVTDAELEAMAPAALADLVGRAVARLVTATQ